MATITTATVVGIENVTKGMFDLEMLTLDVPEHGRVQVQLPTPFRREPAAGDTIEINLEFSKTGKANLRVLEEDNDAMADTGRVFRYID